MFAKKPVHPPIATAQSFDLNKFVGRWYEIAAVKNYFTKGLVGSTATYTPNSQGTIDVHNKGFKNDFNGAIGEVTGLITTTNVPSKLLLKINLMWGLIKPTGDFFVREVGSENEKGEYSYAVVVNGELRTKCWILSREPVLDETIYQGIIGMLKADGFDTTLVDRTTQRVDQSFNVDE
eukprot:TRINITY_DN1636_c0_g1_i2.p1 TRINITY_DN1636_c0_g1~~TRINITY_DN1636_c0_g1_i2.p1  ORF type:complete len:178 (-),score=63.07 TRINITY_DN1636_c0_g1_i2:57-590(-)